MILPDGTVTNAPRPPKNQNEPPPPPTRARVSTAVRFAPALHEALSETADELGVSVNWLVCKLCEEGLERIDLTNFSLVKS